MTFNWSETLTYLTLSYIFVVNSKAIQTIAAILFIFFLSLYICLQTKQARKLTHLIAKKIRKILKLNTTKKPSSQTLQSESEPQQTTLTTNTSESSLTKTPPQLQQPKLNIFLQKQRNTSITLPVRSISKIVATTLHTLTHFFLNSYIYGYTLLVLMVILLTIIQVVLIDLNTRELFSLKRKIKNQSNLITFLCANLEKNYYTEEIIYLIFAILFFLLLIFKQKKKRFSNYIIKKFKNYPEIMDQTYEIAADIGCYKNFANQFSFVIPSFSFSTTNRLQAAAVYIIYTYDLVISWPFLISTTALISTVASSFISD